MCASQVGNLELVQELLQKSADVKAMDEVSIVYKVQLIFFKGISLKVLHMSVFMLL